MKNIFNKFELKVSNNDTFIIYVIECTIEYAKVSIFKIFINKFKKLSMYYFFFSILAAIYCSTRNSKFRTILKSLSSFNALVESRHQHLS